MKVRIERVNGELQRQIAKVIANDIKDPRLQGAIVSVTNVHTTPDLKYASIYFSCIGDSAEALAGLKKCTGMLRHHLAVTLNLRITPELHFVKDGSIEHGAKIARFLEEIKARDTKEETESSGE